MSLPYKKMNRRRSGRHCYLFTRCIANISFGSVLFLAATLIFMLARVTAQAPVKESFSERFGTHYIVLVDDSGDNRGNAGNIQKYVPELLFKGTLGNRKVPGIPPFRPDKDKISVVFFTIYENPNACSGNRENSALPENMFRYNPGQDLKNENTLAAYLRDHTCPGGHASPITTSANLILPFLQKEMRYDSLFSQTQIIVASNNALNGNLTSPAEELNLLGGTLLVADTKQAEEIAGKFRSLFRTETKIEKIAGLSLNISKVTPQNPPAVLHFPAIALDRAAISSKELRLAPASRDGDNVVVYLKGPNYSVVPKFIEISFKDENGAPMKIGDRTLSEPFRYDLKDCDAPRCSKEEDKMTIPLFSLIGKDLNFTPEQLKLSKGKLSFSLGLNYQTDSYDRLYTESQESILLEPSPKQITNSFGGSSEISNKELVGYWKSSDTDGLTSEEAVNRILEWRNIQYRALVILIFVLTILGCLLLYRKYYHRSFEPALEWLPSSGTVIDFDNPAESKVLIGAVKVVNFGKVPWLGAMLREESQPSAAANLRLSYRPLSELGLEVEERTPIGFIRPHTDVNTGEKDLALGIKKPVTHEDLTFIFLATETIRDFTSHGGINDEIALSVDLLVEMAWQTPTDSGPDDANQGLFQKLKQRWKNTQNGKVKKQLKVSLTLNPEKTRKPIVTFVPSSMVANDTLHFNGKEGRVKIGEFYFQSQARCRFSEPFTGNYNIAAYRENSNLGTDVIVPENAEITVLPKAYFAVPVFLICDGEKVLNPAPISNEYTFNLLGEYDPNDSQPGPHAFKLYRDEEKAEIELQIMTSNGERFEVFWDADSSARVRNWMGDDFKKEDRLEDSELVLPVSPRIRFDRANIKKNQLFELKVGNSAKFGGGSVSVQITTGVNVKEGVEAGIIRHSNKDLDDLVEIVLPGDENFQEEPETIEIKEGQISETRDIKFNPEWIKMIQGAIVEPDKISAKIRLEITIKLDTGEIIQRPLEIEIPLYLEQLAGRNWLCIDFGTSAIAVAKGSDENIYSLPLQAITKNGDESLANYDAENSEKDNIKLLPSQIVCDADQRLDDRTGVFSDPGVNRLGFPGCPAKEEALKPGHPNFIGLPAHSRSTLLNPKRVIYSLKSWLGNSAKKIPFPAETLIEYLDKNNVKVKEDFVPLDDVVKSAFSALYEAYLFDPEDQAGQIVITHPNSFTEVHRQRLHSIAFNALASNFDIPRPERFRLISESDAVAYHYCSQKRLKYMPSGSELILVYDFGAGTLDLSLIEVDWARMERERKGWTIRSRLGIPVAGNHIDQLLARLIDKYLRSDDLKQRFDYEYINKVVSATSGNKLEDTEYRRNVIWLWREIREGKHRWKGSGPLEIKVGETEAPVIVLRADKTPFLRESEPDTVNLLEKDGNIYLSIPAEEVHNYKLLKEFIDFVTKDILDEILIAAGIGAADINAVIVSGRGALWPGLRDQVYSRFQNADKPIYEAEEMKQVVANGAIAWQDMKIQPLDEAENRLNIGALINRNTTFVPIDKDFKELNLETSPFFRIVQVGLHNPQPGTDAENSLRRHFYNDLTSINRDTLDWNHGEKFLVKKDDSTGKLIITFKSERTEDPINIGEHGVKESAEIPWPAGYNFLLTPDGKNDVD